MTTMRTRHVLPLLAERGIRRVHRESLAEMSDLLGLQTRPKTGNEVQRRWHPEEVELIVLAFTLRQRWQLTDDDLRALLVDEDGGYAVAVVRQLENVLENFSDQLADVRAAAVERRAEGDAAPMAPDARRTTAA